jgi:hypothetical protein
MAAITSPARLRDVYRPAVRSRAKAAPLACRYFLREAVSPEGGEPLRVQTLSSGAIEGATLGKGLTRGPPPRTNVLPGSADTQLPVQRTAFKPRRAARLPAVVFSAPTRQ